MNKVGFTTSIPIEILIAAQKAPVDLNNIFITSAKQHDLLKHAEIEGFPRNMCSWVKGIYAVVIQGDIDEVIAVTQGDCSNTQALMETLIFKGIPTIPFFYPYDRDKDLLSLSLKKLMEHYDVTSEQCLEVKSKLDAVRKKVHLIDELTWKENLVSGYENHYFQVCTSDMNQNCETFDAEVSSFLTELNSRTPFKDDIKLGYIGVPPIISDLYTFIEDLEGRIVFNETQRQFSMPYPSSTLLEQYLKFTYPYDIFGRIDDIRKEITKRKLDGLIHYVQSFCFRQIEDTILKKSLAIPILTIEGDQPSPIDSRTKMKIEVFLEMLRGKKQKEGI